MPIDALIIGGEERQLQAPGLRVTEGMNGVNRLSGAVLCEDETYRPERRDEVFAIEDGERIFGGLLDAPSERAFGVAGGPVVLVQISATDFNAYAYGRHVVGQFAGGTLLSWLQWVLPLLATWGVTLHPLQDDGPVGLVLPPISYDYLELAQAFDQVSTITGRPWDIDYWKRLGMLDQTGQAAPFDIDEGDDTVEGDIEISPAPLSGYADKVILRFTGAGSRAYAYLRADVNFAPGETVTIGGQSYTFVAVLGAPGGQVLIGASVTESLERLAAAVTLAGGAGFTYSAATTLNSAAEAYIHDHGMLVARALSVGAAGNNITVASTNAAATWYTEGGGGVATLVLGTDPALTEMVTAGTGDWERVIERPDVRDAAVAQLMAPQFLAQLMAEPKEVRYRTDRIGVHPGQVQTITWPSRRLAGPCLITDVEIANTEGLEMRRLVTAYSGTAVPQRWQEDGKEMLGGGSGGSFSGLSGAIVVGGGAAGRPHYHLGASAVEWVESPIPTWTPASAVQIVAVAGGPATLRARLRARDAGVSVTARLYDLTAGAAAGPESPVVTSQAYVSIEVPVTLVVGHLYEFQVRPGAANRLVNAVGNVE
jgi:hypothetical protein